jgi:hypothetical protein
MIINLIDTLVAERREYNSKLVYWKGQERKAKKYIAKYNSTIDEIEKNIKQQRKEIE